MSARFGVMATSLLLALAACGGGGPDLRSGQATTTVTDDSPATTSASTTTTTTVDSTTTSTEAPVRVVDLDLPPPPSQQVEIPTEDGVTLDGRFWEGSETAVILAHHFDTEGEGSFGGRAENTTETLLPWSAPVAREGYTTLAFSWRGHGGSGGEYDVKAGPTDLAAAIDYVRAAGAGRVILITFAGAGPAAVELLAAQPEIELDALLMTFPFAQYTGLDADRHIDEIDVPIAYISQAGTRTERWGVLLERKTVDSRGLFTFDAIPTGLTFTDVYGEEFAGRILDFIDSM